jgi:hypothetical protein
MDVLAKKSFKRGSVQLSYLLECKNKLKEFKESLLDNTLLKVQNQVLGDKNLKWKEWWEKI